MSGLSRRGRVVAGCTIAAAALVGGGLAVRSLPSTDVPAEAVPQSKPVAGVGIGIVAPGADKSAIANAKTVEELKRAKGFVQITTGPSASKAGS